MRHIITIIMNSHYLYHNNKIDIRYTVYWVIFVLNNVRVIIIRVEKFLRTQAK